MAAATSLATVADVKQREKLVKILDKLRKSEDIEFLFMRPFLQQSIDVIELKQWGPLSPESFLTH